MLRRVQLQILSNVEIVDDVFEFLSSCKPFYVIVSNTALSLLASEHFVTVEVGGYLFGDTVPSQNLYLLFRSIASIPFGHATTTVIPALCCTCCDIYCVCCLSR